MIKLNTPLRDEIPQSTEPTGGGDAAAVDTSPKTIWGGSEAPTWTKDAGLEKTHNATEPVKPAQDTKPVQPVQPAQATQPVQAPAQQQMTPEMIASAIVAAQQKSQEANKPAPSDDEIRAQLGIYNANEADYEAILGVKPQPEQVAAFNRVLQAIAKQSVTVSNVLTQQALKQYQDSINPYIGFVRQQEATRVQTEFYSEHNDLKGFEPLVEKEFQNLMASGAKFPSLAEAKKVVAERTRATLKAIGVTPGVAAQQSTKAPAVPGQQTRRMTTTSVGGRTSGSAAPVTGDKMQAVWGN